jgi:Fic family protein
MDPAAFSSAAPGKLVKIPEGDFAFVPEPLPPKLELDARTAQILSEAAWALGELSGVGQKLPNPHLLIGPFLRREAVLSSRIEGAVATAEELLLFEAIPTREPPRDEIREVANYVRALEFGLERLRELPVSLRLMRELHKVLLTGARGEERRPGQFRDRQNYIGNPSQGIADARFVPPPVQEMNQALDDFEKFIHAPSELPFLIRLTLIHYQVEAIHPFIDGNGRIGRLLIPLVLCEARYLPQPLLYLSAYFERNREAYADHLLRVSQTGAWSDWIRFFLEGVAEQSRDAVRRSQRLLDLQQEYHGKLQTARASALLLKLVDKLFAFPALTISHARKELDVTYPSAKRNMQKLVEAGILEAVNGRRRNRVYIAPEIISIIEAEKI